MTQVFCKNGEIMEICYYGVFFADVIACFCHPQMELYVMRLITFTIIDG